jgi:hypothetical protein
VCVIMLPEAVTLRAYNVDVTVSDPTEGNEWPGQPLKHEPRTDNSL